MHRASPDPRRSVLTALAAALAVFLAAMLLWEHALGPAAAGWWPAAPPLALTSVYGVAAGLLAVGAARPIWRSLQRACGRLEDRLDADWETTGEGVLVVDLEDGRILASNGVAREWLGEEPQRLDALGIPSTTVFRDQVEEAGAGEAVRELDLATTGGWTRHLEVHGRLLDAGPEQGRPCLVRLRDATAERRTETRLRAQSQRFRTLVSGIDDVVLAIDGEGSISYASPSCGRQLGRWPGRL